MAYTALVDQTLPAGTEPISSGDDRIRDFKRDFLDRIYGQSFLILDTLTTPMAIGGRGILIVGSQEDNAYGQVGYRDVAGVLVFAILSDPFAILAIVSTSGKISFEDNGAQILIRNRRGADRNINILALRV